MSSSGYILQAAGWGCSCPKGRSINSKKECLAAAHTLVAATEHIQQSQEQLEVLDNIWEFPPCGCFVWKGGYSVIYADPNDESIRECRANQWAQLICREGDVEQAQFEEPDDPTLYEPKKCLDWIGYKPIRFLRDPRFCIGVTKDENGDYQPVVKLCSDVELLFGDEHWWWYNFYNQICIQDDICFEIRTEGKGADPALVLAVSPSAKIENRWSFNSDGRFQSLANPAKYISVAGCELKEGAMLEINSIKDECVQRFTVSLYLFFPTRIAHLKSARQTCFLIG